MAFPKAKARNLVLDGQAYQWTISQLASSFTWQIRVSAGGAVLVHGVEIYTLTAMAIKPCFVVALIRHGLAAGWQPTIKGPEFRLKSLGPETFVVGGNGYSTRIENYKNVFDVPETGTLLCCRADIEPLREQWPWDHHHDIFVNFRIWGGANDKAIGSFMANMTPHTCGFPAQDAELALKLLARSDPYEWDLSGGVQLWQNGRLVMNHGCCASLPEWAEWQLETEEPWGPWNGHDPHSSANRETDQIDFYEERDRVCASLKLDEYERCLARLRQDLKDFTVAVHGWARQRVDQATARRIAAKLTDRLQLR